MKTTLAAVAVLALGIWGCGGGSGDSPSSAAPADGREKILVGFLPVTCHLTCPVTDFATKSSKQTRFESQRFTDFPTMVETMKSGRLDATFMIMPLAMKIREQGVPVKICYLGHRDGSTVMVHKESTAKDLKDLKGKTFAIPSKASNQNLVIHKLMEMQGLQPDDIKFVEMPPPDMPGALAAKAIDAYFVGEPHAAKAEVSGFGRVLYHAKDIWPQFISCCLVVTEKLIREKRPVVEELVASIAASGEWAENHRLDAAKVVSPYFRQDQKLVEFVLTQPPDRVSYRQLTPGDDEIAKIGEMAFKAGVLKKPVDVASLLDKSFIPKEIKPQEIDMSKAGQ